MPNWEERLKILVKIMDAIEQGKALITWQDKNIVKVEKIETEVIVKK